MARGGKSQLGIHLDVGHDSIGWCVTRTMPGDEKFLIIPGSGVVLFPADDCLANKRRDFRRQRRHIRATRQRIERMKSVLLDMGVMTEGELKRNLTAAPWKLAAEVLTTGKMLSWPELWAVLRWYAHNRGYDGNALATLRSGRVGDAEDIKKNEEARGLMVKYGTASMAETMCHYMKIEPSGKISASRERFKGLGVSFDRSCVENEVRQILLSHKGVLKGVDDTFIHLLMASPVTEPHYLRTIEKLPFHVPNRYWGGVLFGQLAPRFDNRIIGSCPITGEKLPSKGTSEFLRFRFAMMLSHVRVGSDSRPLSADERGSILKAATTCGGFQKGSFKKIVDEVTGENVTNIDALLTAPEADKSLVLLPGLFALTKALSKKGLDAFLEPQVLRRMANRLFRGSKRMTMGDVIAQISADKQEEAKAVLAKAMRKGKKKAADLMREMISAELPSGRAPYARSVLVKVAEAVLRGEDPSGKGGILYRDATKEDVLKEEDIDRETNNHLIRHRVKILLRLLRDIVYDYAENNPAQVSQVTIEMARDLKDLSGMTNKEIVSEMLLKTAHHRNAAKKLAELLHCDVAAVSAGLIRKMRIAQDLDFTCPYTGWKFDPMDVVHKNVDLDHILPRSQRATDSLDSMVLTFTEVNRMKGARTGLEFVREFGGQRVNGRDNLVVLDEKRYRDFVDKLRIDRYSDDKKRQKRRQEKLLKLHSEDAGMTEGMLTRTSYITTLATKAIRGFFANCGRMPRVVSVPGRVTAELRKQWRILDLLAESDPRVLDENGDMRLKQEIRGITHMHHAVDAITLGLAATLLPVDGTFWAMMCKRRVKDEEKRLLASTGVFRFTAQNEPRLVDLPPFLRREISTALAEQRVVVHQPQGRTGLKVQQNTWGVEKIEDGMVYIRQRSRDEKSGKIAVKRDSVTIDKAFGANPISGKGKLKDIKGVLLPDVNFGVALLKKPMFIRHQRVWNELALAKECAGKMPLVVRRGGLIRIASGNFAGVWRVASVKDNTSGIALDIIRPNAVKVQNGVDYAKINVRLAPLVGAGLEVVCQTYTGVASCPTTSLTSRQTGSRSR